MTPFQEIVVGKLIVFVEEDPGSLEVGREFTRRECMELLGLIDRLTAKAEGGRPPARLGGVRLLPADAEVSMQPAGWMPPSPSFTDTLNSFVRLREEYPRPFDGTYPQDGDKRAGAKEPPPAGSGGGP